MNATLGAAAFAAHAGCAVLVLRAQARRTCGWRMAWWQAIAGQVLITAAGLLTGLAVVAIGTEIGVHESPSLYALGVFAGAVAWTFGLLRLTDWLAQNADGSFYSPATMRRISLRSLARLFGLYAVLGMASLFWWGQLAPA